MTGLPKTNQKTTLPILVFENIATQKQLLARGKYLLKKTQEKWSESQQRDRNRKRKKTAFSYFTKNLF